MKTHFKHYSNKAAKDAALADMKVAKVSSYYLFMEKSILNTNVQVVRISI